jgi:hypothetical protein
MRRLLLGRAWPSLRQKAPEGISRIVPRNVTRGASAT